MSFIMIDVEADGPAPGLYSMTELGAVLCSDPTQRFYTTLAPISERWSVSALAPSGYTREQTLKFTDPMKAMTAFNDWLSWVSPDKPRFISDNNGFDWQFINYYFYKYLEDNPFGHSSTNLGSLYKGLVKDSFKNFKGLRKIKHTHHPIDDCLGNVEALDFMINNMGLKFKK